MVDKLTGLKYDFITLGRIQIREMMFTLLDSASRELPSEFGIAEWHLSHH